jgi:hypothetical protein
MVLHAVKSNPVERAARITQEIEEHVAQAIELCIQVSKNPLGIYSDPPTRLSDLRSARDSLNMAITEHLGTRWPTRGDYDSWGEGKV